MCPTKTPSEILWAIYRGDDGIADASHLRSGRAAPPAARLIAAEDGMISLVTVVALLFFLVLLGLIANAVRLTNQKMDVQNAADSVAYSSALCMSRGMNTVTAANHVMGELTAVAVLIDALAGDGHPPGNSGFSRESASMNQRIQETWRVVDNVDALIPPLQLNGESLVDLVTADGGMHDAGATIYDAKMTLKYWTWYALVVEGLGKLVSVGVPGLGAVLGGGLIFTAEIAYLKIHQEWIFLQGLQIVAGMLIPIREAADTLVPLVHAYAHSVVKQTPLAVAAVVKSIADANRITGALYPSADAVRLPLMRETPPQNVSQSTYNNPNSRLPGPAQDLVELMDKISAARNLLKFPGMAVANGLANAAGKVLSALGGGKNTPNPLQQLSDFFNNVGSDPSKPSGDGFPAGNPSQKPFVDLGIDDAGERNSQWVRATYPWVNAWRAPVRGAMDELLTFSMASLWYKNWTNKYTLARSHRYRTNSNLFMYVMQDSQPGHKGEELWTRRDGSRLAEKRFMVVGFAHRSAPKPFSPTIYKQPNLDGLVAYAQAMIYNANEKIGGSSDFQPPIGWDTLNWKSPPDRGRAYEFDRGDEKSSGDWSRVLDFLRPYSGQNPSITLNWQAKLVPVTRLEEARNSSRLPGSMRKILSRAADWPRQTNH